MVFRGPQSTSATRSTVLDEQSREQEILSIELTAGIGIDLIMDMPGR
jgi:hypothetical protein